MNVVVGIGRAGARANVIKICDISLLLLLKTLFPSIAIAVTLYANPAPRVITVILFVFCAQRRQPRYAFVVGKMYVLIF